MDDLNMTEALVRAILEIMERCSTLEEAKEAVRAILNSNREK